MTKTSPPDALVKALAEGDRYVITSHLSPDGDAIGSSLALARLLRKLGKVAQVWLHDPVPAMYAELAGSGRVHVGNEPPDGFPESFDAAITVECPTLARCGLEQHLSQVPVLNIDHHLGNEGYGVANWVDTAAPALGEMILTLAGKLKLRVDEQTAMSLLVALVSDTGGFRYSNTSERAFDAAGELVRNGADPRLVAQWLWESRSEGGLRLIQETLATLEIAHDGKVATVLLTDEMLDRSGATSDDTEGLVEFPRSIASVEAVAMVRQVSPGAVKVSLRSRDRVNVEEIARRHGGGGHRNAAGFRFDAAPDAARETIVEELGKAVQLASSVGGDETSDA